MAEGEPTPDDQKTEDPTERRLEKSFEEGKIAYSRELVHWVVLASAASLLLWMIPATSLSFIEMTRSIFENCGDAVFSNTSSHVTLRIMVDLIKTISLLFVIVVCILAVGLGQTKGNFTLSQIKPKWERISPFSGFKRIFGKKSFVEFLKNLVKMLIVGSVMLWALGPLMGQFVMWSALPLHEGLTLLKRIFADLFLAALSIIALLAGLDYIYQRFSHWKSMKMSKQEVKDEHKEREGNPQIKAKLRELRLERVRSQMGQKVKTATAVITNPTHYAVAILWDEHTMETPKVVAKGTDFLAQTMRELAKTHNVPLVENPPLARSLYEKVNIDKDIMPEHYRPVADVIKFVTGLGKKRF